MHDPYGVQHFYLARMEEGRRLSKQKTPQPEAMADMMANVLVSADDILLHFVLPHPKSILLLASCSVLAKGLCMLQWCVLRHSLLACGILKLLQT